MYLKCVEIENFKSFSSHIHIPFSPGFNLICGPNGTGKSNLLDAICCAFGCEPRLLRVTSYPELLNTQGLRSAHSGYVAVHLTTQQSEDIVRVDITQKGATWSLNNRQQSVKEIRAYGQQHGYDFSEGSVGIVRQNYVVRLLDDPRMLSDAIENANGAKRLLESIRVAHAELVKSKESQEAINKALVVLKEKVEEEEKKKKDARRILEVLDLADKTKLQLCKLKLCLAKKEEEKMKSLYIDNKEQQTLIMDELNRIEENIKDIENKREERKQRREEKNALLEEKMKKRDLIQEAITQLILSIKEEREETERLEKQLKEMQNKIVSLQTSFDSKKDILKKYDLERKELKEKKNDLIEEGASLNVRIKEVKKEIKKKEDLERRKKEIMKRKKEEREEMLKKIKEEEERERENELKMMNNLRFRVTEVNQEIADLNNELNRKKSSLESALHSTEEEIKRKEEEIINVKNELLYSSSSSSQNIIPAPLSPSFSAQSNSLSPSYPSSSSSSSSSNILHSSFNVMGVTKEIIPLLSLLSKYWNELFNDSFNEEGRKDERRSVEDNGMSRGGEERELDNKKRNKFNLFIVMNILLKRIERMMEEDEEKENMLFSFLKANELKEDEKDEEEEEENTMDKEEEKKEGILNLTSPSFSNLFQFFQERMKERRSEEIKKELINFIESFNKWIIKEEERIKRIYEENNVDYYNYLIKENLEKKGIHINNNNNNNSFSSLSSSSSMFCFRVVDILSFTNHPLTSSYLLPLSLLLSGNEKILITKNNNVANILMKNMNNYSYSSFLNSYNRNSKRNISSLNVSTNSLSSFNSSNSSENFSHSSFSSSFFPPSFPKGRIRIWPLEEIENNLGKKKSDKDRIIIKDINNKLLSKSFNNNNRNGFSSVSSSTPSTFSKPSLFHPSSFLLPISSEFLPIFQKLFFGTCLTDDDSIVNYIFSVDKGKEEEEEEDQIERGSDKERRNSNQRIISSVSSAQGILHKRGVVIGGANYIRRDERRGERGDGGSEDNSMNRAKNTSSTPFVYSLSSSSLSILSSYYSSPSIRLPSFFYSSSLTIPSPGFSPSPSLLYCKYYLGRINEIKGIINDVHNILHSLSSSIDNHSNIFSSFFSFLEKLEKIKNDYSFIKEREKIIKKTIEDLDLAETRIKNRIKEEEEKKKRIDEEWRIMEKTGSMNKKEEEGKKNIKKNKKEVEDGEEEEDEKEKEDDSNNSSFSLSSLLIQLEKRKEQVGNSINRVKERIDNIEEEIEKKEEEKEGESENIRIIDEEIINLKKEIEERRKEEERDENDNVIEEDEGEEEEEEEEEEEGREEKVEREKENKKLNGTKKNISVTLLMRKKLLKKEEQLKAIENEINLIDSSALKKMKRKNREKEDHNVIKLIGAEEDFNEEEEEEEEERKENQILQQLKLNQKEKEEDLKEQEKEKDKIIKMWKQKRGNRNNEKGKVQLQTALVDFISGVPILFNYTTNNKNNNKGKGEEIKDSKEGDNDDEDNNDDKILISDPSLLLLSDGEINERIMKEEKRGRELEREKNKLWLRMKESVEAEEEEEKKGKKKEKKKEDVKKEKDVKWGNRKEEEEEEDNDDNDNALVELNEIEKKVDKIIKEKEKSEKKDKKLSKKRKEEDDELEEDNDEEEDEENKEEENEESEESSDLFNLNNDSSHSHKNKKNKINFTFDFEERERFLIRKRIKGKFDLSYTDREEGIGGEGEMEDDFENNEEGEDGKGVKDGGIKSNKLSIVSSSLSSLHLLTQRLRSVQKGIAKLEEVLKESRILILKANKRSFLKINKKINYFFNSIFSTKEVRLIPCSWIMEEEREKEEEEKVDKEEEEEEREEEEGIGERKEAIEKEKGTENNLNLSLSERFERLKERNSKKKRDKSKEGKMKNSLKLTANEQLLNDIEEDIYEKERKEKESMEREKNEKNDMNKEGEEEDSTSEEDIKVVTSSSSSQFIDKVKDIKNFTFTGGIIIQMRDTNREIINNEKGRGRKEDGIDDNVDNSSLSPMKEVKEERKSQWREGLSEMSGGQKTLLSISFLVSLPSIVGKRDEKIRQRIRAEEERRKGGVKGKGVETEERKDDGLELDDIGFTRSKPRLVMFDEIDSNLDESNQTLLSRLLSFSFSTTQVISVSHLSSSLPSSSASSYDCVISLDRKSIQWEGDEEGEGKEGSKQGENIALDSTFVANITYKKK